MTAEGQATEVATQGLEWAMARPAWVDASKNFAESDSGEIHVFQGPVVSTESIWCGIEYPVLKMNPNVTDIIYHGVGW